MLFSRFAVAAASVAALFAGAQAQNSDSGLTILSPGGPDLWWIVSSINVITWTCHTSPFENFTVVLANQDPTKWAPLGIIAIEQNFDCSKTITPDLQNAPVGTGYLIQFANTLNISDIYAASQPFEIKPTSAGYPASSATPQATGAASSSGSSSSGSSQPTGTAQKPSGAGKTATAGLGAAAAVAALGLFLA